MYGGGSEIKHRITQVLTSDAETYNMSDVAKAKGRPSNYELYDQLIFNGQLPKLLHEWRVEDGLSYDAMVRELAEYGVVITGTSVLRWCRALGIEKKAS